MTAIAVAPIILTDCLLTLGTDSYEAHVSQVQFDPDVSIQTWKGLTPTAKFSKATGASWTCTLSYAQDWETEDSLSQYLFDHQGEEVSAHFEPVSGGAGWDATLIIVPGSIGGNVDEFAVATVQCGVSGVPALS